jgi:hypothetical protein
LKNAKSSNGKKKVWYLFYLEGKKKARFFFYLEIATIFLLVGAILFVFSIVAL